jgi:hypothetical protein
MYQDYLEARKKLKPKVTTQTQDIIKARKQLKELQQKASVVSNSVKAITLSAKLKLTALTSIGIGLLSLIGYLNSKKSMYQQKYTPFKEDNETNIIKNKIVQEAQKQNVDPDLALAVAQQESNFNPKATSPAGAQGIFQLMPQTAKQMGVQDPYDIDQNIKGGIKYLKWCLDNTNTTEEALVAYNAGIGNLQKAKKQGKQIDSITDKGSYAKSVMDKQQNFKNKPKSQVIKTTNAGKIQRLNNGTMIGQYKMSNPVAHDGKYYIDLSERAQTFLKESGGKGLVTSGAEGSHAKGTVSHASGNKVDIVAVVDTDNEWAETAIPFIENQHTAYINFEDFTENRFNKIKNIIYTRRPDLKSKCESSVKYSFGTGKKFLFRYYTGGGLHLDIGILPDAYSYKEQKQQNKNNIIVPDNKKQKPVQNTATTTPKQETSKNTTQNILQQPQPQTKILQGIDTNKVNVLAARNFNKSKRKS